LNPANHFFAGSKLVFGEVSQLSSTAAYLIAKIKTIEKIIQRKGVNWYSKLIF